jgi:hypothetical protein
VYVLTTLKPSVLRLELSISGNLSISFEHIHCLSWVNKISFPTATIFLLSRMHV